MGSLDLCPSSSVLGVGILEGPMERSGVHVCLVESMVSRLFQLSLKRLGSLVTLCFKLERMGISPLIFQSMPLLAVICMGRLSSQIFILDFGRPYGMTGVIALRCKTFCKSGTWVQIQYRCNTLSCSVILLSTSRC